MVTKVLDFPQHYKQTAPPRDTAFRLKGTEMIGSEGASVRMRSEGFEEKVQLQALIDIDVLYPAPEGAKTTIVEALTSLASAIALLEEARQASAEGNPIAADDFTQHFQMLLPRLFRYRNLGDGYGTIINSIHFAFANQRGKALSPDQTNTIWRVLKELRIRPFLSFDKALDYVTELENSDLKVDPSTVSELLAEDE